MSHGALVQAVTKGSPAAKAGLRAGNTQTSDQLVVGGDLIVEVAGKPVREPQDIATAIADKKPGDTITLKLYRHGDQKTVSLTLGNRPNKAPGSSGDQSPIPGIP